VLRIRRQKFEATAVGVEVESPKLEELTRADDVVDEPLLTSLPSSSRASQSSALSIRITTRFSLHLLSQTTLAAEQYPCLDMTSGSYC
jgi:hypothetical protein